VFATSKVEYYFGESIMTALNMEQKREQLWVWKEEGKPKDNYDRKAISSSICPPVRKSNDHRNQNASSRDFVCAQCKKAFRRAAALVRHKLLHQKAEQEAMLAKISPQRTRTRKTRHRTKNGEANVKKDEARPNGEQWVITRGDRVIPVSEESKLPSVIQDSGVKESVPSKEIETTTKLAAESERSENTHSNVWLTELTIEPTIELGPRSYYGEL